MAEKYSNPFYEIYLAEGLGRPAFELDKIEDDWFEKIRQLRRHYAYACPRDTNIQFLSQHGPLLEIGAGKGYWSHLIQLAGGDIVPTDIVKPKDNTWFDGNSTFTDVEIFPSTKAAVEAYPDRTIFLCWPHMDFRFADMLRAYESHGHTTIWFVGESPGNACLSEYCWEEDFEPFGWRYEHIMDVAQFDMLYDDLQIIKRQERT